MKYAKLPNGKTLEFADNVSEKEMRLAVRKELGLSTETILEEIDALAKKVDDNKPPKEIKLELSPLLAAIRVLTSAIKELDKTTDLQGFEHAKAVQGLAKALDKHEKEIALSVAKALEPLNKSIEKLTTRVFMLEEVIQKTSKSQLDIINDNSKSIQKVALFLESGIKYIVEAAKSLHDTAEILQHATTLTKTAYKNHDGSWTMKTVKSPTH